MSRVEGKSDVEGRGLKVEGLKSRVDDRRVEVNYKVISLISYRPIRTRH